MTTYDPNMTLGEAVKQYFIDNKFGDDGGYGARWVEVKIGPVPFFVMNTESRVRAVRFHDLHHVMTGYKTDLAGESEIAAWELSTYCADKIMAWYLNLVAFNFGLLTHPIRTIAAFRRGRSNKNFYSEEYTQSLLSEKLGDARKRLGLDKDGDMPMTSGDLLALIGYILLSIPAAISMLALGIVLLPVALFQNAIGAAKPAAT